MAGKNSLTVCRNAGQKFKPSIAWGAPYYRVLLLLGFNRHFHCPLQTEWELSLGGSGQSSFEPYEWTRLGSLGAQLCLLAAAGPEQVCRPRAESRWRVSKLQTLALVANHPPTSRKVEQMELLLRKLKTISVFFVCLFLYEDNGSYSWKWLYRFIHSSVSISWASTKWKATGNKADGENLAHALRLLQSPHVQGEKTKAICFRRHLASLTQEAAVLQDSANPFSSPPGDVRHWGKGMF